MKNPEPYYNSMRESTDYYLNVEVVPEHLRDHYDPIMASSEALFPLYSIAGEQMNGLSRYLFTTAIVTDLNPVGYAQRFCYENFEMALSEHIRWHQNGFSPDKLPRGWIRSVNVTRAELIQGLPEGYFNDVFVAASELCENKLRYFGDIEALQQVLAAKFNCSQAHIRHAAGYFKAMGLIQ